MKKAGGNPGFFIIATAEKRCNRGILYGVAYCIESTQEWNLGTDKDFPSEVNHESQKNCPDPPKSRAVPRQGAEIGRAHV
jgi:hypothetical protein